jgi:hypothetical protein
MSDFDDSKIEEFKTSLRDYMLEAIGKFSDQDKASVEMTLALCCALSEVLAKMAIGVVIGTGQLKIQPSDGLVEKAANAAMNTILDIFDIRQE